MHEVRVTGTRSRIDRAPLKRAALPSPSFWRRLVELWSRQDNPLETAIERMARQHFGMKEAEPGDVVVLNAMIEELCRSHRP